MAERDQFLGQPVNHALGTAVELRRHGLGQRRYLGDVHENGLLSLGNPWSHSFRDEKGCPPHMSKPANAAKVPATNPAGVALRRG